MSTSTFSNQVRDMWDTRPLRARQTPFAGVATGFARRYAIDVALVRAALIAATLLGGAGVVAYLAGLVCMPKEPPVAAIGYRHHRRRPGPAKFVLVVAVVFAIMAGRSIGPSWPGSAVVSGLLLLAGWYLLHQRCPVPPAGTSIASASAEFAGACAPAGPGWAPPGWTPGPPWARWSSWTPAPPSDPSGAHRDPGVAPESSAPDPTGTDPTGTEAGASSSTRPNEQNTPQVAVDAPGEPTAPPRWDPLGAAPFAWDLPDLDPAPVPVPRPRTRVTAVTLGLALLTVATLAAVRLAGVTAVGPVLIAAIALGVIGAGLVVGAFRRSGYGLLAVAIPLAGFVVIGTSAQNTLDGFTDSARGDHTYTVTDPAALRPEYRVSVGRLTLDLRALTLDHDRTIDTRVRAGETRITVPRSMNVEVRCSIRVGDANCPDGRLAGSNPSGPTLTINARGNVGDVEVDRG